MEISQSDFDLLVQQIRELTARVHRLETALAVPSPRTEAPRSEKIEGVMEPPRPPTVRLAPPPSSLASPPKVTEHLDLENRIGSHWLNRIGIAAVLFGLSFFLKYAFDNGWIGPAGLRALPVGRPPSAGCGVVREG